MEGKILVTGGAGYIGSHTVVELLESGFSVLIFDNLSNSRRSVLDRIATLTGKHPEFIEGDIRDRGALRNTFWGQVGHTVFLRWFELSRSIWQACALQNCRPSKRRFGRILRRSKSC